MRSGRKANVLLVEDSISDQIIIKRSIEEAKVQCNLYVANNGREALDMLSHAPPYQDKTLYPKPDLILLDMNMPIMNGKETLQKIRETPELKHLPVVILTTSTREKDVLDSYRLGVNAYLAKPMEESGFVDTVVRLEQFWFEMATLPSDTSPLL